LFALFALSSFSPLSPCVASLAFIAMHFVELVSLHFLNWSYVPPLLVTITSTRGWSCLLHLFIDYLHHQLSVPTMCALPLHIPIALTNFATLLH
jgi:hypothetical protein